MPARFVLCGTSRTVCLRANEHPPLFLSRVLQGERNYIMQVVCEATQSASSEVQVAAFECLVKIMHLYYDWMKFYMERALFGVRSQA